jgi:hypothetical protein
MISFVGVMFCGFIAIGFSACGDLSGNEEEKEDPTYGWYGNGSSNSFTINNFTQLKELANIVQGNTGYDGPAQSDFRGKTITLAADINMSGKSWYGLGYSYLPLYPFNGTFDGNNKTISGLNMYNQGFFGLVGEDGVVKNLVFIDLSVDGSDGGGGVARTNKGKIQNISVNNGSVSGIPGGIVCHNYGIVENCSFSGNISGGGGGIADSNAKSGVIRNCYVTGSVSSSSNGAGGIVNNNFGTVQNCLSNADIISSLSFIDYDKGGIVGYNDGTVQYCYATGSVTGDARIGGIVGSSGSNGTVRNCVALNLSIGTSSTSSARVANDGLLINNYARVGMTLPNGITAISNANGIHGEDVDSSVYNSQIWWTTAVNWDFNTVWQWDNSRNLPKLRVKIF